MDNPKDEGLVYHYTSLEALQSMLANEALRLSELRRSNDSKELSHGLRMIAHRMNALDERGVFTPNHSNQTSELDSKVLKTLNDNDALGLIFDALMYLSSAIEYIPDHALYSRLHGIYQTDVEHLRLFAMCFSARSDSLLQWQSYGGRGAGISIGFDRNSLKALENLKIGKLCHQAEKKWLHFGEVFYEYQDSFDAPSSASIRTQEVKDTDAIRIKRDSIFNPDAADENGYYDTAIRDILLVFSKDKALIGSLFDKSRSANSAYSKACNVIKSYCLKAIALAKNWTFQNEHEERLYCWANSINILDESMREIADYSEDLLEPGVHASDGLLTPYFSLKILRDCPSIKEVILGPSCKATPSDIRWLFKAYKLPEPVIRRSKCSLVKR